FGPALSGEQALAGVVRERLRVGAWRRVLNSRPCVERQLSGPRSRAQVTMTNLVSDFSTHPLVPGGLLASVMGDPESRRAERLDNSALLSFNKLPTLDLVGHFQNAGLIANEQATEIIATDNQYVTAFRELGRRIPEVAQVTGTDRDSVEQLARALFSAKLMSEYLEILTPPQLSYERTAGGTVDLLELLFDSFRQIVGGAWSVFFPRAEFSLATDASAQFWMACLYSNRCEEMV